MSSPETLLTDHQLAPIIGRARRTLQLDRWRGGGIPFIKVGRLVRYRMSDVEAWLRAQPTRTSTSERMEAAAPSKVEESAVTKAVGRERAPDFFNAHFNRP